MSYDPLKEAYLNEAARKAAKDLYDNNAYQLEKILGRRTKTGALKLKRLSPMHRHIIALHLKAHSNRDIAHFLDINEITVSRVLHDPLAQEYIRTFNDGIDLELSALASLGVDALRRGLQDKDAKISLKASDQLMRALGKYHHTSENQDGHETAEDVVAKALELVSKQSDHIKELSRPSRPRALDVDFTEVNEDGNQDLSSREADQGSSSMELVRTSERR